MIEAFRHTRTRAAALSRRGAARLGARLLGHAGQPASAAAGAPASGAVIHLEFPFEPRVRYGHGRPPHAGLEAIVNRRRAEYATLLAQLGELGDDVARIRIAGAPPGEPQWHNAYFFGLDALTYYGLIALRRPARIIEVGSGNSTMFARRAIRDHGLDTQLTCIDPEPRADVTGLCDELIRMPLQDAALEQFDRLQAGDMLFLDSSHVAYMNSDVTAAFLDVIPALRPGVLLHVHDVFLPWDYRPDWTDRWYNEQYLLATALLAEGPHLEIVLPAFFVYNDAELSAVLAPLWERLGLHGYERAGHSFWLRTGPPS